MAEDDELTHENNRDMLKSLTSMTAELEKESLGLPQKKPPVMQEKVPATSEASR